MSKTYTTLSTGLTTANKTVVGAINEVNNKIGEMKIYTSLDQLSLTSGITTTTIFNAMPNNSLLRIEVADNAVVTDIPKNTNGVLMIDKVSNNNVTIEYKITSGELFIGVLTIGDTTSLSWKRLCSTTEDNYESGFIWISKYLPTGATGNNFYLSYSVKNGCCFVSCGGGMTTSANFDYTKIDLTKTTWSTNTGKTIFPKPRTNQKVKLFSEKNNVNSLLLLEIYPTGEVYMFHSGSLITDKNEYWQGTLCYAILE